MARDTRKSSAYASGMRGSEKPRISPGNVQGEQGSSQPTGGAGGESAQGPRTKVGDPEGVGLSAYSSGMRGVEKPQQKSPDAATQSPGDGTVSNPKGQDTAGHSGPPMGHSQAQQHTDAAGKMGISGNNTEAAVSQDSPSFEDDETHVHIKVPKAAFKRRTPSA